MTKNNNSYFDSQSKQAHLQKNHTACKFKIPSFVHTHNTSVETSTIVHNSHSESLSPNQNKSFIFCKR